ncbi:MAG: hydroxypyruvate isomerase family protein [Pseudomonas sp.]
MKIAANLSLLFTEYPLLERVAAAAEAGFQAVEIQFPYSLPAENLKCALAAHALPLVLINLPAADLMEGGPGLAAVPDRADEFEQALAEALAYAKTVKPFFINVLPGRLAANVTRAVALETLVQRLRRCAEAFEPLGIGVLAEAINPLDMPGFLINTAQELRDLVEQVNHPNMAAQLDLYHMARQQLESEKSIALLAGKIGHVQFADCPGRGEPGSGTLDFARAMRALEAAAYKGWWGAEYRPTTSNTRASLGWLADWSAA